MVAKILISPNKIKLEEELIKLLTKNNLTINHPDVLNLGDEKLNLEQAKKIKEFFTFKPHQAKGKIVIVNNIKDATLEAQNALLKTIEELPKQALIIISAPSEDIFLPTFLSRCEIIKFNTVTQNLDETKQEEITNFINSSIQDRFYFIERIKDKEEFLLNLILYFQQQLHQNKNIPETKSFLEQCVQTQKWASSNVNVRGILEYLALIVPKI